MRTEPARPASFHELREAFLLASQVTGKKTKIIPIAIQLCHQNTETKEQNGKLEIIRQ